MHLPFLRRGSSLRAWIHKLDPDHEHRITEMFFLRLLAAQMFDDVDAQDADNRSTQSEVLLLFAIFGRGYLRENMFLEGMRCLVNTSFSAGC